jgi:hypothetical protein
MSTHYVPVGDQIVKMVVESKDALLDLSQVHITLTKPTQDDLKWLRNYVKENKQSTGPYKQSKCGFGAILEGK